MANNKMNFWQFLDKNIDSVIFGLIMLAFFTMLIVFGLHSK